MTVGTVALTGALRHPLITAHQIATLDRISEGRTILALGAGLPYPETQAEFEAVGVPFERRVGLLMETIGLWRRRWCAWGQSTDASSSTALPSCSTPLDRDV